jgi:hypothetical protein
VTELSAFDEPLVELESLLRMAGNYVQPSEDLRPRILEASRCYQQERKVRHRIGWGVVCIILLSVALTWDRYGRLGDLVGESEELAAADVEALLVPDEAEPRGDAFGWYAVESFTALRRRHAEQLRSL